MGIGPADLAGTLHATERAMIGIPAPRRDATRGRMPIIVCCGVPAGIRGLDPRIAASAVKSG